LSRSSRIHKSTAIGALAACAVIGATSPVWADTGSSGSSGTASANPGQAVSPQDAATISALQAEVSKLQAQVRADDHALSAATKAESLESKATAPATTNVAPPAVPAKPDDAGMNGRHNCGHGDHGDFRGRGPGDDQAFGADWHGGPGR
jgi:hypothetical protein